MLRALVTLLFLVLLLINPSICSSSTDVFSRLYGTYTTGVDALSFCKRSTDGPCAATCCILNATLTDLNTPNVTRIDFNVDLATISRCAGGNGRYRTTLTVSGYNAPLRQVIATSANNAVMGNVQVSIAFDPIDYPRFLISLTPSGGQACTLDENFVSQSGSLTVSMALVAVALLSTLLLM